MFLAFCFACSSVYVFNDIIDIEKDINHPTKCKRPIAAKKISIPQGFALMIILFVCSLALAITLSLNCLFVLLAYFLINVAYSTVLKDKAIIDVACIALGFVLRVVAGSLSTEIPISNWLLLTIIGLSFFMGFGKRKSEFCVENNSETRHVLKYYSKAFLDNCMHAMMSVTIVFYSLWTIDPNTIKNIGSNYLIYTTFIVIIGLLRYTQILEISNEGDPSTLIWKDKALHTILIFYSLTVLGLIYL